MNHRINTVAVALRRTWSQRREDVRHPSGDQGSILILALVFLLVTSLTVYTIATLAGNSLLDATKFNQASALDYATSGAVQIEAQNMRYVYQSSVTNFYNCTPLPSSQTYLPSVSVYCSVLDQPTTAASRTVTFDSCAASVSAANCQAAPYLQAVISFDDYNLNGTNSCTSSLIATCGTSMSITGWQVE
jgi:hypothetical protein